MDSLSSAITTSDSRVMAASPLPLLLVERFAMLGARRRRRLLLKVFPRRQISESSSSSSRHRLRSFSIRSSMQRTNSSSSESDEALPACIRSRAAILRFSWILSLFLLVVNIASQLGSSPSLSTPVHVKSGPKAIPFPPFTQMHVLSSRSHRPCPSSTQLR